VPDESGEAEKPTQMGSLLNTSRSRRVDTSASNNEPTASGGPSGGKATSSRPENSPDDGFPSIAIGPEIGRVLFPTHP
jgi:hypothetical protein